jgi:hypothetical protein
MCIVHTNCIQRNRDGNNFTAVVDETQNFVPLWLARRFGVSQVRARVIAELLGCGGVE